MLVIMSPQVSLLSRCPCPELTSILIAVRSLTIASTGVRQANLVRLYQYWVPGLVMQSDQAMLADVFLPEGRNVNHEMVKEGW